MCRLRHRAARRHLFLQVQQAGTAAKCNERDYDGFGFAWRPPLRTGSRPVQRRKSYHRSITKERNTRSKKRQRCALFDFFLPDCFALTPHKVQQFGDSWSKLFKLWGGRLVNRKLMLLILRLERDLVLILISALWIR